MKNHQIGKTGAENSIVQRNAFTTTCNKCDLRNSLQNIIRYTTLIFIRQQGHRPSDVLSFFSISFSSFNTFQSLTTVESENNCIFFLKGKMSLFV